ncbi:hypothetical protein CROQUDRAFT_136016 [Cronartium quercuum f. sp. fusiforme G11]|uniref:Uncharacterized protein n=1 Tax=Cronartium quercuum f. sp. fusiforme G11 TaxID=708437 RepID=A0A9P6NCJ5_9BASI|nr:hypothetical protein CROQUDRAFT_136016 [Cronartium quercuum f. sp. fusiforme G11]
MTKDTFDKVYGGTFSSTASPFLANSHILQVPGAITGSLSYQGRDMVWACWNLKRWWILRWHLESHAKAILHPLGEEYTFKCKSNETVLAETLWQNEMSHMLLKGILPKMYHIAMKCMKVLVDMACLWC